MVVTQRRIDLESYSGEFEVFVCSDLHIGSSGVDHDRIVSDLAEAKRRGARILINGDIFDAILPSDHKRFAPEVLAKRIQGRGDVLNGVIEYAEELLAPFAENIDVIGVGNHDTAVTKYHSLEPVSILIDRLNSKHKGEINHGGYSGYYQVIAKCPPRNYWSWILRYHHGSGGSAPVTKGMIDHARMLSWVSNADVLTFGHKHNKIVDAGNMRERLTSDGNVVYEPVMVVHTASYYEPSPGRPGWAQERNFAPQDKGGVFLKVKFWSSQGRQQTKTTVEL